MTDSKKNTITEIIRLSGRSRLWIALIVGIVTSTGICLEMWRFWATPVLYDIDSPRYLISRRSISQGTTFNSADFGAQARQGGEEVNAGVTDQDLYLVQGSEFIQPVAAGVPLTWESLKLKGGRPRLGKKIPRGMRAYVLNPEFIAVRSGDLVDVVLTPDTVVESPFILVDAASVLEAGFRRERFEVVLALSPGDIEMVEKGKQRGKLKIALRNPDDSSHQAKRLQSSRKRPENRQSIEILTEGP
jgi:Flp pilus assembly protein CpaB